MSLSQQKFREIVLQLLYSIDIGANEGKDLVKLLMRELSVTKKSVLQALERVNLVRDRLESIDEQIAKTTVAYSFKRIQSIERNVLRLGVYELVFDEAIPPKVAITEAMRLARKFGSPEGALFVNAIMDAVYRSMRGEEQDNEQIQEAVEDLEKLEQQVEELKECEFEDKSHE